MKMNDSIDTFESTIPHFTLKLDSMTKQDDEFVCLHENFCTDGNNTIKNSVLKVKTCNRGVSFKDAVVVNEASVQAVDCQIEPELSVLTDTSASVIFTSEEPTNTQGNENIVRLPIIAKALDFKESMQLMGKQFISSQLEDKQFKKFNKRHFYNSTTRSLNSSIAVKAGYRTLCTICKQIGHNYCFCCKRVYCSQCWVTFPTPSCLEGDCAVQYTRHGKCNQISKSEESSLTRMSTSKQAAYTERSAATACPRCRHTSRHINVKLQGGTLKQRESAQEVQNNPVEFLRVHKQIELKTNKIAYNNDADCAAVTDTPQSIPDCVEYSTKGKCTDNDICNRRAKHTDIVETPKSAQPTNSESNESCNYATPLTKKYGNSNNVISWRLNLIKSRRRKYHSRPSVHSDPTLLLHGTNSSTSTTHSQLDEITIKYMKLKSQMTFNSNGKYTVYTDFDEIKDQSTRLNQLLSEPAHASINSSSNNTASSFAIVATTLRAPSKANKTGDININKSKSYNRIGQSCDVSHNRKIFVTTVASPAASLSNTIIYGHGQARLGAGGLRPLSPPLYELNTT